MAGGLSLKRIAWPSVSRGDNACIHAARESGGPVTALSKLRATRATSKTDAASHLARRAASQSNVPCFDARTADAATCSAREVQYSGSSGISEASKGSRIVVPRVFHAALQEGAK